MCIRDSLWLLLLPFSLVLAGGGAVGGGGAEDEPAVDVRGAVEGPAVGLQGKIPPLGAAIVGVAGVTAVVATWRAALASS